MHASLGARLSWGPLPNTNVGVGLSFAARMGALGGLHGDVAAYLQQEATASVADEGERGVELRLYHAGLAYCPLWLLGDGRFQLLGCAGLDAGAVSSRGTGVSDARDATRLWLSGEAFARAYAQLWGPMEISLRGGLGATLTRVTYETTLPDGSTLRLFDQGALFGQLALELGARF